MNIFKRKIIWALALLTTHIAAFLIGGSIARNVTLQYALSEAEKADAHVLLGHYTGYRDIAIDIKENKYSEAKCLAELSASAMFDSLKTCVSDLNCRGSIEQKLRATAPEVLGESPIAFGYIANRDDMKTCK